MAAFDFMLNYMTPQALNTLNDYVVQIEHFPSEIRRLFHGRGQLWPGLEHVTIDWLEGQILISLFKEPEITFIEQLHIFVNQWCQQALWQKEVRAVLLQHRSRESSPIDVLYGHLNTQPIVQENTLSYHLNLGQKQNNGLFLDMRYGRKWVQNNAKDKNILNLFAYTCGFSVAAIAGGASHVVNVDMAKAALGVGRNNHRLNRHDTNKVSFLGHDIFKSWGKIKKLGAYDLIIIDPPTFQKGSFALTKDYKKILKRLPDLLSPNGQVLACVNDPSLTTQFLVDEMAEHAPAMKYHKRLNNPKEFADKNPEASLKCVLFTRF